MSQTVFNHYMANEMTAPPSGPPAFGGLRLVAGHPALDFVNSVKFRGMDAPGDRLTDYEAALAWSQVAGIIDEATASKFRRLAETDPAAAEAAFRGSIELREALRRVLPARNPGARGQQAAKTLLDDLLARLAQHRRFDPERIGLRIELPVTHPRDLILWIGVAIEDLLTRDQSKRIGFCDGEDCDWVYLDGGRGRARRWCDSRTCGNAARVRQHRSKKTTEEDGA